MTTSQRIELIRELRECLAEVKQHLIMWNDPNFSTASETDPVERTVGILIRAIERNVEKIEQEPSDPIAKVTFDDGTEKLVHSNGER